MTTKNAIKKLTVAAVVAAGIIGVAIAQERSTGNKVNQNLTPIPPSQCKSGDCDYLGAVGLTRGQTARLNAYDKSTVDNPVDVPLQSSVNEVPPGPCRNVELMFIDSMGHIRQRSTQCLMPGHAVFLDLNGNTLDNATAIGALARVDCSNCLVLGSINGVNFATADTFVGIGTTAPAAKLHVSGGGILLDNNQGLFLKSTSLFSPQKRVLLADTGNRLHIGSGGGVGFDEIRFDLGTPGTVMTMLSNGSVGIGTTITDQVLSVNGDASKIGGGSWQTFSDERLKNIKGSFTPGLRTLRQLQPLRYQYKPNNALGLRSEGEYVGFSAQAVQRVLPEAVSRTASGYLQLNNDPILWTMLNAIKEQQSEIEQLKFELHKLRDVKTAPKPAHPRRSFTRRGR
jgi:hypothetical protein